MRFADPFTTIQEYTRTVKTQTTRQTVEGRADAEGLVSHAGAFLLVELADRLGLTAALSAAMMPTRERRSAHDAGVVLRDLAVALADGGDHLSDLGVLRGRQPLFGAVASETTAHRVLKSIDSALLEALRGAHAEAPARAWDAGGRPEELIFDIDASLLIAHSEKEGAAGNYKGGFGFFPLLCYLAETGEPLAGILRPGNAGANTASDHSEVLQLALEQLPGADLEREMLARADIGGRTHAFTADCRETGIRFSVGYEVEAKVRKIGRVPSGEVERSTCSASSVTWVPSRSPPYGSSQSCIIKSQEDASGWFPRVLIGGSGLIVRNRRCAERECCVGSRATTRAVVDEELPFREIFVFAPPPTRPVHNLFTNWRTKEGEVPRFADALWQSRPGVGQRAHINNPERIGSGFSRLEFKSDPREFFDCAMPLTVNANGYQGCVVALAVVHPRSGPCTDGNGQRTFLIVHLDLTTSKDRAGYCR